MAANLPNIEQDILDGGGGGTSTSSSGKYYCTVGSVSFSGFGISDFADYLNLITGSTYTNSSIIDLSTLKTTHCASSSSLTNTINTQLTDKFKTNGGVTFNTFLGNVYPGTGEATITLPYKDNGTAVSMVLPGTTPQFNKRVCYYATHDDIIITITRTSSSLTVKYGNSSTSTYTASDFDGVIPLRLIGVFQGGGGGGSSSHDTTGGGGGGSGAFCCFILDLATNPTMYIRFVPNGKGAGGYGKWNGTEEQHSGKPGASILIAGADEYVDVLVSGAAGHDTGEVSSEFEVLLNNAGEATYEVVDTDVGWTLNTIDGESTVGPQTAGKSITSTYYIDNDSCYGNTKYFNGNPSSIYMQLGNTSGGAIGAGDTGDNRGGGGSASMMGNGGSGGQSKVSGAAAGGDGDAGAGGGGGGFYFGSWQSGGDGGSAVVSIWY